MGFDPSNTQEFVDSDACRATHMLKGIPGSQVKGAGVNRAPQIWGLGGLGKGLN